MYVGTYVFEPEPEGRGSDYVQPARRWEKKKRGWLTVLYLGSYTNHQPDVTYRGPQGSRLHFFVFSYQVHTELINPACGFDLQCRQRGDARVQYYNRLHCQDQATSSSLGSKTDDKPRHASLEQCTQSKLIQGLTTYIGAGSDHPAAQGAMMRPLSIAYYV